jgi:hypothetical protein
MYMDSSISKSTWLLHPCWILSLVLQAFLTSLGVGLYKLKTPWAPSFSLLFVLKNKFWEPTLFLRPLNTCDHGLSLSAGYKALILCFKPPGLYNFRIQRFSFHLTSFPLNIEVVNILNKCFFEASKLQHFKASSFRRSAFFTICFLRTLNLRTSEVLSILTHQRG